MYEVRCSSVSVFSFPFSFPFGTKALSVLFCLLNEGLCVKSSFLLLEMLQFPGYGYDACEKWCLFLRAKRSCSDFPRIKR